MKTEVLEFRLSDHPGRLTVGLEKKNIARRGRDFYGLFNPGLREDRDNFWRCLEAGEIQLNGHRGVDLAGFHPAFAQPEAEKLLAAIHAAGPAIEELESQRQTKAAEIAVLGVAREQNENPNSAELFISQIESREHDVKVLDEKIRITRRNVGNDKQRLRELRMAADVQECAAADAYIETEVAAVNAAIMEAYQRADRLRSHVERRAELGSRCGRPFSAIVGDFESVVIEHPGQLMRFQLAPGLQRTLTALRFGLRLVRQTPQEGGKK